MKSLIGSLEWCNNFNLADDVLIECRQVFGRDPILAMLRAAHNLDFVLIQKGRAHLEAGNLTALIGFLLCVPITSNFFGVLFTEHRIKERLTRVPRREFSVFTLTNQIQFPLTYGSVEHRCLNCSRHQEELESSHALHQS